MVGSWKNFEKKLGVYVGSKQTKIKNSSKGIIHGDFNHEYYSKADIWADNSCSLLSTVSGVLFSVAAKWFWPQHLLNESHHCPRVAPII